MAWNRPTSNTGNATSSSRPAGCGKVPRLYKGLVAGAIVVLGAGLAAWLLTNGEATSSSLQKKDRGLIKEATPATAPKAEKQKPAKPVDPKEDYDHEKLYRDGHGILRFKDGNGRAIDPTMDVRPPMEYFDRSLELFKHQSEKSIMRILLTKPGEAKKWRHRDFYDPGFLEDFQESLKTPIIATDTDSERTKNLKHAMNEVKIEICDRMRNGESLGDILTEARKEMDRLADYKRGVEKTLDEVIEQTGGLSDAELDDYISAANKMLEENGVTPVKKDRFVEWNIQLNHNKAKEIR